MRSVTERLKSVMTREQDLGLNQILFIHRNHKLNEQVQETQKQYAYLSVTGSCYEDFSACQFYDLTSLFSEEIYDDDDDDVCVWVGVAGCELQPAVAAAEG